MYFEALDLAGVGVLLVESWRKILADVLKYWKVKF